MNFKLNMTPKIVKVIILSGCPKLLARKIMGHSICCKVFLEKNFNKLISSIREYLQEADIALLLDNTKEPLSQWQLVITTIANEMNIPCLAVVPNFESKDQDRYENLETLFGGSEKFGVLTVDVARDPSWNQLTDICVFMANLFSENNRAMYYDDAYGFKGIDSFIKTLTLQYSFEGHFGVAIGSSKASGDGCGKIAVRNALKNLGDDSADWSLLQIIYFYKEDESPDEDFLAIDNECTEAINTVIDHFKVSTMNRYVIQLEKANRSYIAATIMIPKHTSGIAAACNSIYELILNLMEENERRQLSEKKVIEINEKLENEIRSQAHIVKNTIQPKDIDRVICSIRSDPNNREDVLTLHRVRMAEYKILNLNKLMEIKLEGDEELRHAVQRSTSSDNRDCVSVQNIIDQVFSRFLDIALNPYQYNLQQFSDEIVINTGCSLNELRTLYDDAVVASYATNDDSKMPVWHWFSKRVFPLSFRVLPVWNRMYIKNGSAFETLLFKWFNELILNALKYHAKEIYPMIDIALTETRVGHEDFLKIEIVNPISHNNNSESQIGLQLIRTEVNKINEFKDSLRIDRSPSHFTVAILVKKSLLISI